MRQHRPTSRRPLALALAAAAALLPPLALGQVVPGGDGAAIGAALADPSAQTVDRFIVKFRDEATPAVGQPALQRTLDTAAARLSVGTARAGGARGKGLAVQHVRRMGIGADVIRTSRGLDRVEAQQLMQELASDPNVEYVEVDQLMQIALTPNDTNYASQWHYFEATGGLNLPTAWDRATGSGVVVAVLDTGYVAHSDLAANTIAGYDFISDATMAGDGGGRDGDPADPGDYYNGRGSSWHGTHVAGTIAAVTNNGRGVAGVAYNARVQHVRVLGRGGGWSSDIADGITWASGGSVGGAPANPTPADVINLSLGGAGACGTTTQNAINGAVSRGTVVVVAAGNANTDASQFNPANCANVITVAATNRQGARASYSNYGTLIDVAAPGGEGGTAGVLSTLNSGTQGPGAETYAYYAGTSMAAPHVAGLVALMQSAAARTPAQVEALLKSSARPLPGACSGGCGAGIVDAGAALAALLGGGAPAPTPTPPGGAVYASGTDVAIRDGATVRSPIAISGRNGQASATSTVTVDIVHPNIGDLQVSLEAPDGSRYVLHNRTGGGADDLRQGYVVDLSSEAINGTWHLRVYDAVAGHTGYINAWSLAPGEGGAAPTAPTPPPPSAPGTVTNGADVTIADGATVRSPIAISGRGGFAGTAATVTVAIIHPNIGDLQVALEAPDGSRYILHNRTGGSADNLQQAYTVDLSSEAVDGTWHLRVYDGATGNTGYIDQWSFAPGSSAGAPPAPAPTPGAYANEADVAIRDGATVRSPISLAGVAGQGSATARVVVDILHPNIGDLQVALEAPDGTRYMLHNRAGGSADNLQQAYTVDLSAKAKAGTWHLRVYDAAAGNTGVINRWSFTP